MDERRERRGRERLTPQASHPCVKPVESVFRQLFESIEKDATSKVVKAQAQLIQRLRMKAPVQQTNPVLDRAEKQLFQLVKDRGDPSDITLQSEKVQSLRADLTQTAPAAAGKDSSERRKPTKPDQRREPAGSSPAPVSASKEAREPSKPAEREHGRAREPAGPPPPRHTARPVPEPKPAHAEKQENKRPGEPLDTGTSPKSPQKSQTSSSSVRDPLDLPSLVCHARQSPLAPKPSQDCQQENKQLGVPLELDTRYKPPPRSVASASFIGDHLEAPTPPQRGGTPIPALKPSHLHRQDNERPSTAPEAGASPSKQPHSNASTSSIGSRFDLPIQPPHIPRAPASSPPQRGRQPISALKPSPLQRQENPRPSTAPEPSAPTDKRPHSHASTLSFGSRFISPSQPPRRSQAPAPSPPQRGRQPLPFPRPSQLPRQENARPSTAPESSAATNKRPRSSASVSSRTSTFAAPHSPERGRQRERTATPPPRPPKRRRADTQQSPDNYPRSDSPSPPPPRAPGIPPRPRFTAKYSITDKEDKASRALMHPASKPLAKLPDAARLMTGDFDQVAKVHKPHPSFEKAKLNANNKHVRHVNRAGGRGRVVVEEERSLADRIGMPPAMAQAWAAERAQAAAAGSARGGPKAAAGGVARGREEAMKLIDAEFGPGGGEEGGGVL
ncbi:hypothetical protein VE00_07658 [Pseudogymnoascus sp. WSF 3629]|nr:hypothetical protein VE00_07658 [Pseudogymnoascus sp. WSF 3629]